MAKDRTGMALVKTIFILTFSSELVVNIWDEQKSENSVNHTSLETQKGCSGWHSFYIIQVYLPVINQTLLPLQSLWDISKQKHEALRYTS